MLKSLALTDAPQLATIHAAAFSSPWSAAEFASLLEKPAVMGWCIGEKAFILLQSAGGEAEILTLATQPSHQRRGLAKQLVEHLQAHARLKQWQRIHLEVAASNGAAIGLYQHCGFTKSAIRKAYYKTDAGREDAITMRWVISHP